VLQLLQRIQDPTVGAEPVLAHDVLELDQAPNVEGARVVGVVVGGIQVDDGAGTADGAHELVHYTRVRGGRKHATALAELTAIAIGAFAAPGATEDELRERHLGGGAKEGRPGGSGAHDRKHALASLMLGTWLERCSGRLRMVCGVTLGLQPSCMRGMQVCRLLEELVGRPACAAESFHGEGL